jgi:hypothetical protein
MSKEVENSKQWHLRDAEEIENLESGKEVVLYFNDGSDWTGIFKSISDDLIILQSLDDKTNQIGLPLERLTGYIERFK